MEASLKKCIFLLSCITFGVWCSQAKEAITEKPIVVVACSYNTSEWSHHTLESIFTQHYSNFRVILVDDCSTDGNQEVIQNYIDENDLADRVSFIKNTVRKRKLFNLYRVLYECNDDEIVVMVDGDDWLAHPDVLSYINKMYDDEDLWFTYGQYKNIPASQAVLWGHKEMGYCRSVPKYVQKKHAYRYYSFIYMHLRTFRSWLFKLVKLEDLIAEKIPGFEGDFYPASNDVAMYFPMVEMAHTHIKFVPDILYIRNLYSGIVGFKVDRKIQVASAREIRKKQCYSSLFKPKKNRLEQFKNASADAFIVCKYSVSGINVLIDNIKSMTKSLGKIHVFFRDTEENKTSCRKLKQQYPEVIFVPYSAEGVKSLKNRLLDSLSCSGNEHFFIATDTFSLVKPIDLSHAIYNLEKTFAYRFYLNRDFSQITARYIALDDIVCAWKFSYSVQGWHGVNMVNDVILCRKSDFLKDIKGVRFDTVYGLVNILHHVDINDMRVGLFYNEAHINSIY